MNMKRIIFKSISLIVSMALAVTSIPPNAFARLSHRQALRPIAHKVTFGRATADTERDAFTDREIAPNDTAVKLINELLNAQGAQILSLGSGDFHDEKYFASQGCNVTAVEKIESDNLRLEKYPNIRPEWGDIRLVLQRLVDIQADKYDAVYARLSLHYFSRQDLEIIFEQIEKLLRPGGRLYFVVKSKGDYYYITSEHQEDTKTWLLLHKDKDTGKEHKRQFLDRTRVEYYLSNAGLELVHSRDFSARLRKTFTPNMFDKHASQLLEISAVKASSAGNTQTMDRLEIAKIIRRNLDRSRISASIVDRKTNQKIPVTVRAFKNNDLEKLPDILSLFNKVKYLTYQDMVGLVVTARGKGILGAVVFAAAPYEFLDKKFYRVSDSLSHPVFFIPLIIARPDEVVYSKEGEQESRYKGLGSVLMAAVAKIVIGTTDSYSHNSDIRVVLEAETPEIDTVRGDMDDFYLSLGMEPIEKDYENIRAWYKRDGLPRVYYSTHFIWSLGSMKRFLSTAKKQYGFSFATQKASSAGKDDGEPESNASYAELIKQALLHLQGLSGDGKPVTLPDNVGLKIEGLFQNLPPIQPMDWDEVDKKFRATMHIPGIENIAPFYIDADLLQSELAASNRFVRALGQQGSYSSLEEFQKEDAFWRARNLYIFSGTTGRKVLEIVNNVAEAWVEALEKGDLPEYLPPDVIRPKQKLLFILLEQGTNKIYPELETDRYITTWLLCQVLVKAQEKSDGNLAKLLKSLELPQHEDHSERNAKASSAGEWETILNNARNMVSNITAYAKKTTRNFMSAIFQYDSSGNRHIRKSALGVFIYSNLFYVFMSAILIAVFQGFDAWSLFKITAIDFVKFDLKYFFVMNIFSITAIGIIGGVLPGIMKDIRDSIAERMFGDIRVFFEDNPNGFKEAMQSRDVVLDIKADGVYLVSRRGVFKNLPLSLSPRIRMIEIGRGGSAAAFVLPGYRGSVKVTLGHYGTNQHLEAEDINTRNAAGIKGVASHIESGYAGNRFYLVFDTTADALDIRRLIEQRIIPFERALEIFIEAAHIVSDFHQHGYSFQDVKPMNFLVGERGWGEVQIIDLAHILRFKETTGDPRKQDFESFQRMLKEYLYEAFTDKISLPPQLLDSENPNMDLIISQLKHIHNIAKSSSAGREFAESLLSDQIEYPPQEDELEQALRAKDDSMQESPALKAITQYPAVQIRPDKINKYRTAIQSAA
jgi:SAM-dependent methyltransferase